MLKVNWGRLLSLVIVLLAGELVGCATVLGPSRYDVRVRSDPPGARVWVNGQNQGATPTVARVPSGDDASITVALDGSRRDCVVPYRLNGVWVVVDLVFGLLPLIVDAATGAWYEPSQKECVVYFGSRDRIPQSPRSGSSDRPRPEGSGRVPLSPRTVPTREPQGGPRFSEKDAAELCSKGVERFCPKPAYNEAEAIEACNKGDERACRAILERRSADDAKDPSEAESPETVEPQQEAPKRRVFKPATSAAPQP